MKKLRIILLAFLFILIFSSQCFAVHIGIIKNIPSYQCDDYDVFIPSTILEQDIFNYLGYKKFRVQVQKNTKSLTYTQKIKNYIGEKFPAPIYDQKTLWDMLNNEDHLIILQVLEIDLKQRTAIVVDQSIWSSNNNRGIYTDDGTGTFPNESYFYLIDENYEYGKIANDSIAFLESIKDIYLNPEIRRKYEAKEARNQIISKGNNYLSYWTNNLTPIYSNKGTQILMDIPSFHQTEQKIFEGWLKFVPDDSLNMDFKESKIFFKVDYYNSTMYAIFQIMTSKSGQEVYSKASEKWTIDDGKFVNTVLKHLDKKFKLGKTFRQMTGFDVGDPNKKVYL